MNVKTSGVVCDNPQCDWKNEEVSIMQMSLLVNHPCPKCGQNILTVDDYIHFMQVIAVASEQPDIPEGLETNEFAVKIHDGISVFQNTSTGKEEIMRMTKDNPVPRGVLAIMTERCEQIYKHNYTAEDDSNQLDELIKAMVSILLDSDENPPSGWSHAALWKITQKPRPEQIAIVGAWAAAWIDGYSFKEQTA